MHSVEFRVQSIGGSIPSSQIADFNPWENEHMTKYNINELLEKKKDLEEKVVEAVDDIEESDLEYTKEIVIDHTREDKQSIYEPRKQETLENYSQQMYGYIGELAEVKTAIQKYNAESILGKLQIRESTRIKINYLKTIRKKLPSDVGHDRIVTRRDKDNVALESKDVTTGPMFNIKEIDKQLDQLAAQERKVNTAIQRLNLEAEIEI